MATFTISRGYAGRKTTVADPDLAAQVVVRELVSKSKGLAAHDAERQLGGIRDWAADAQSGDSRTFCASYVFDKGINRGREWSIEVDICRD
jgi:hypothetical protein